MLVSLCLDRCIPLTVLCSTLTNLFFLFVCFFLLFLCDLVPSGTDSLSTNTGIWGHLVLKKIPGKRKFTNIATLQLLVLLVHLPVDRMTEAVGRHLWRSSSLIPLDQSRHNRVWGGVQSCSQYIQTLWRN